jgi:hypothetical protein
MKMKIPLGRPRRSIIVKRTKISRLFIPIKPEAKGTKNFKKPSLCFTFIVGITVSHSATGIKHQYRVSDPSVQLKCLSTTCSFRT